MTKKSFALSLLSFLLLFTYHAPPLKADVVGKIVGMVTDEETGESLIGVTVLLEGTERGTVTDVQGRYFLLNVPVGTYTLTFSQVGFRATSVENVVVKLDATTEINVTILATPVEVEGISIVAERPVVDTRQSASIQTLDYTSIKEAPIRSTQDLLDLSVGVVRVESYLDQSPDADIRGLSDFRVRGGRFGETIFLIDNLPINNPIFGGEGIPIPDEAISQYDFLPGGYEVQYGNALSGVVNVLSRDGGTDYEASAELLTSSFGGIEPEVDELRDFQDWEGTFNGPIPGYDRLRFFFDYSGIDRAFTVYEFDDFTVDPRFPLRSDENRDEAGLRPYSPDFFASWRGFYFDDTSNGFGKLSWQATQSTKLSGVAQIYERDFRPYRFAQQFEGVDPIRLSNDVFGVDRETALANGVDPAEDGVDNGVDETERDADRQSFQLNQLLANGKIFYTASVSRFHQDAFTFPTERDTTTGERIVVGFKEGQSIPSGPPGGVGTGFFNDGDGPFIEIKENTTTWTGDLRATGQFFPNHELQFGGTYNTHDLFFFQDRILARGVSDTISYGVDPWDVAIFAQDEVTYDFAHIKLGLRADFGDATGSFFANPLDPLNGTPEAPGDDFAETDIRFQFSPRLNVSFPVTATSNVFFNFGRYSQVPLLRTNYERTGIGTPLEGQPGSIRFQLPAGPNPLLGNPQLDIEKTTAIELGYQTQLAEDFSLAVAIWTKDQFGLSAQEFTSFFVDDATAAATGFPKGVNTFNIIVNQDFATTRGIDLQFAKRLSDFWAFQANYTFSRSTTNSSEPFTSLVDEIGGDPTIQREVRSDVDQPHIFNLLFNIAIPPGERVQFIDDLFPILSDSFWSVRFQANSGLPFTPILDLDGTRQAELNSGRRPPQFQVDLRARKGFRIGDVDFAALLQVDNIFDRKNPVQVFPSTGDPEKGLIDEGRDGPPQGTGTGDIPEDRRFFEGFFTSTFFDRPHFFGLRRTITLGLRAELF